MSAQLFGIMKMMAEEIEALKKQNAKLQEQLCDARTDPVLLPYTNEDLKEYLEDYIDRESEDYPKPTKDNIEFGDDERDDIQEGIVAQLEPLIEDEIRDKAWNFKYNEKTGKYEYEW